jgi:hypothetical protein
MYSRIALAIAIAFLPLCARAQLTCAKVEYGDARDWPIEKLEEAYCRSDTAMRNSLASSKDLMNAGLRGNAQSAIDDARRCQEQHAMLGRVLENVHKRSPPDCK